MLHEWDLRYLVHSSCRRGSRVGDFCWEKHRSGKLGGRGQEGDQKSLVLKGGEGGKRNRSILSVGLRREKKDMKQFPSILHVQGERNRSIRIRILGSLSLVFSLWSLVCFLVLFYASNWIIPCPFLLLGLSSVSRWVDNIRCLMASFAMELICAVSFRDLLDP